MKKKQWSKIRPKQCSKAQIDERIPFAVDSGQGGLQKRLLTFYTKGGSPDITLSVIEWAREASPAGAKRPPATTGRAVALELHRTHAKICT